MKAIDLMIGDYVFWDWVTHKVDYDGDVITDKGYEVSRRIIKVSSVNDGGVTFKSLKDGSQIYIREEDLAPIPLTEEILEKNGFGFIDMSNDEYSSIWTGWWILEGLELGCCNNSKFPVFFNIADTNVKVNYVHELQHALKLCKIEKEIVL